MHAVVVTHNGASCIDACLTSLGLSGYPLTVTVVDNASSDVTQEVVDTYPAVRLISLSTNVGFGRANNLGIQAALADGAEYVLLLNQDAMVLPGTVGELVRVAEQHERLGVITPLHLNGDGSAIDTNFLHYVAWDAPEYYSDLLLSQPKRVYRLGFANAAAWLVRRSCLEAVGGFDPLFFMYCEDDDLCTRMRLHGWELGFCPSAVARHSRHSPPRHPRRWTRLWRRSSRLVSNMILSLKSPHRPFPVSVLLHYIDLARFCVTMMADGDRQGVMAAVIAASRATYLMPAVWLHRRRSLRGGRLWL